MMGKQQKRAGLIIGVLYFLLIAAMFYGAPAQAADNSPDAHKQAIQCTVFASMADMDEEIITIHRHRTPKEFGLSQAYQVGLAEGKVLGFAASNEAASPVPLSTNTLESAQAYYVAEHCTISEKTALREEI